MSNPGTNKQLNPLNNYLSKKFIRFIKYLFSRQTSNYFITLGRRQTGKTDYNLLILEVLHSLGYKNFASNIKIKNSYFPIEYLTNMVDLEDWASNTSGSKTYILDEYGKAFKRRSPMAKMNIAIIDKLQILRKYQLNLLAITIHEKYVDSSGLGSDVLDGVFYKPYFRNQKIALYHDNIEDIEETLRNIQGTRIHFDTWDIAPFTINKPIHKPQFTDKTLNLLWEWSHGRPIKI